jgi:exosortase A
MSTISSSHTAPPAPPARTRRTDALVLGGIALALVVVLVSYGAVWSTMVRVWLESDTFAHGMLIAPISLWLVWRRRAVLARLPIGPWYPALPAIVGCGAVWLLADLAGVNAPAQFAVVGMIIATVALIAGRAVAGALLFPLAFLLLMVPFGEFLQATMMDHTADVTIWAVRASGVPVYREGLHFVLPTGRWSVVEACSGLRYLIASVVLGTLYAYVSFESTAKRLAFIAASILTPIVANWLRAYGIVMIGHLSGMQLATGVDHLVYGWAFFGVVMFALFWVGARWRDDPPAVDGAPAIGAPGIRAPQGKIAASVIAALVAIAIWPPLSGMLQDRTRPLPFLERLQAALPELRTESDPLGFRPSFSNARAEALGTLPGALPIGVQSAYYTRQHESVEMISHGNVLVSPSNKTWHPVREESVVLAGGSGPVRVRRTELAAGPESRLLVYHWFTIAGRHESSTSRAKLLTALSVLSGAGDHSVANAVWIRLDPARPSDRQSPVEQALRDQALRLADITAAALR